MFLLENKMEMEQLKDLRTQNCLSVTILSLNMFFIHNFLEREKRDEEKAVKLEEDKGDIFDQMLDKVSIKHKTKQTKTQKQKNSKKAKKTEEKPEDKKQ